MSDGRLFAWCLIGMIGFVLIMVVIDKVTADRQSVRDEILRRECIGRGGTVIPLGPSHACINPTLEPDKKGDSK